MSPAFIKGVRDNLPKAKITFDKDLAFLTVLLGVW
jgi:hypothetical protein